MEKKRAEYTVYGVNKEKLALSMLAGMFALRDKVDSMSTVEKDDIPFKLGIEECGEVTHCTIGYYEAANILCHVAEKIWYYKDIP